MTKPINPETLPNFLIIGAAKTGTTSLYHYLQQHPQIFMSAKKEPHFFCFEGQSLNFPSNYDNQVWQNLAVTDLEAYQALFENVSQPMRGEASTNYLYYHAIAAQRIYDYAPHMKLIVILRNPVDRAFSAFQHRRRDYREPLASFKQALDEEPNRMQQNWEPGAHYFHGGLYYDALKTYFSLFPPEQIRIFIYEHDIRQNIKQTLIEVFRFLGVDENVAINIEGKYNSTGELQSPILRLLHRTLLYHDFIQSITRRLPEWIVQPVRNAMYMLRRQDAQKATLSDALRCELQEKYREDILKTQDLIGRDLSFWLRCNDAS